MIRREREDDLGGTGDEMSRCLLLLDRAEETEEIGEHESVGKFRRVIDTVNLATVLGKSGEGDDVVEIDLESGVNVIDESFDVLFRGCNDMSVEA